MMETMKEIIELEKQIPRESFNWYEQTKELIQEFEINHPQQRIIKLLATLFKEIHDPQAIHEYYKKRLMTQRKVEYTEPVLEENEFMLSIINPL